MFSTIRLDQVQILALLLTITLTLLVQMSSAAPSRQPATDELIDPELASILSNPDEGECAMDSEIRDMCERCAKLTKSEFAYPLCCRGGPDESSGRTFCENLIGFELKKENSERARRESRARLRTYGRLLGEERPIYRH